MTRFLNPLFFLLAGSTENELRQQVLFLKTENRMLRSRIPHKIHLKARERKRLIELGLPIRSAVRSLISVVTYRSFCRWTQSKPVQSGLRKGGRPRTARVTRDIIIRLASETGWGYTRILGELYKLGIKHTSRKTVRRILGEHGFHPGSHPDGSWQLFLRSHWKTLWACDFFTKKVWTTRGLVECSVLFFIHLESRRVFYAGSSPSPDQAWVCQQARNFSMHVDDLGLKPSFLLHDLDTKFTVTFDNILKSEGVEIKKLPFRSPNLNAFAERWISSIKNECLNRFIVFGQDHLDYLIREYVTYYNRLRPHQGKDNQPLEISHGKIIPIHSVEHQIQCQEFLGGVLKHYQATAPPIEIEKMAA